jgi:ferritin
MIVDAMQKAINEQVNAELYSAYLYLSMKAYFEDAGLPGFANWMQVQTLEESSHAMKLFGYLVERGGRVHLGAIEEPPSEWEGPQAVFENVLAHEQFVTGRINSLMDLAIELKDHATANMLQWFIAEQVEEEASADTLLQKVKLMKDAPGGLFMLDQELAARVFTPPAAAE